MKENEKRKKERKKKNNIIYSSNRELKKNICINEVIRLQWVKSLENMLVTEAPK